MNVDELELEDGPPRQSFDAMLSAAWAVRPLSAADLSKLVWTKRWYTSNGVGLSKDELNWLTKLATRGGWKPAMQEELTHA